MEISRSFLLCATSVSKFSNHMEALRGVEVYLYYFFNLGVNGGGRLAPRPGRFTPGKNTRYPLYKMLGVPQARCGRVRTNSPHLQFCILLYSVCTSSLLGSFSWLSCILPFVCTYNTQHKHPCSVRIRIRSPNRQEARDFLDHTATGVGWDSKPRPLGAGRLHRIHRGYRLNTRLSDKMLEELSRQIREVSSTAFDPTT